ncbi:MAG: sensor N-terminal transmembrane domain-containing protein, partial [Hyphomicrobiales bacterium]|nr:sensor N-terminal transmembrane domain-containing protein [Hyphomicrobiales bacterium]
MTAEAHAPPAAAARPHHAAGEWRARARLRRLRRALSGAFSSSVTRRNVTLNLGGLVALFLGFMWIAQFREGLIEARTQSLSTQGEIIAAAIAASATVETDTLTIDPEKLMRLAPGQTAKAPDDALSFSINPEQVGPMLRRLVQPTGVRAQVFDRDGTSLIDTQALSLRGNIVAFDLPLMPGAPAPGVWARFTGWVSGLFAHGG